MKRGVFVVLCLLFSLVATAQQSYPTEWNAYMQKGYLSEVQSDINRRDLTESEFLNLLVNNARVNLAKQIQVRVQDHALMHKEAINGRTNISYNVQTRFSTDVELKLVETRTFYDANRDEGAAIAFIDKAAARRFYLNAVEILLNKCDNASTIARNYIDQGFKTRAQEELKKVETAFEEVEGLFVWLSFFDYPQTSLKELMARANISEQQVKQTISELQHADVILLTCKADMFGSPYPLQNELKGVIAAEGCSFTSDPSQADWIINVSVSSREGQTANIGTMVSYFSFLDAEISIDKCITSQRIYEDAISVKGGHPQGYPDAARKAFKDLKNELGTLILTNIKQK